MTVLPDISVSERKRIIWKVLTKNFGISTTSEAMESLINVFKHSEHSEQYLKIIAQSCKKSNIVLLDAESLKLIVESYSGLSMSLEKIENASHNPIIEYFPLELVSTKYSWNQYKKKFEKCSISMPLSLQSAEYLERFCYLKHLHESSHSISKNDREEVFFIHSIPALSGIVDAKVTLFGMISISKSGSILLEDPDGTIPLTWTSIPSIEGIIVSGTMVLVTGRLNGSTSKTICVTKISQPTSYLQPNGSTIVPLFNVWENSRKVFSDNDLNKGFVVVISDVYLDDPIVVSKLEKLLDGFNQDGIHSSVFAFIGHFQSPNSNILDYPKLAKTLSDLILSKHHLQKQCHFLMIPDLYRSASDNLNLSPIASFVFDSNEINHNNSIILSNPSRIRYQSKYDILFVKYPYLRTFSKNSLFPPICDIDQLYNQILFTCHRQAHMFPFSQDIQTSIPGFDHGRLVPNPDIIFISDDTCSGRGSASGDGVVCIDNTRFINVGSFSSSSTFVVYYPNEQKCEQSYIP